MTARTHSLLPRARALRREMTPPERALWQAPRADRLGVRFRRQHPIPPFILDFACIEAQLVVEIDGATHADPAPDEARDTALRAAGWRVLRFWNNEVMGNLEGVVGRIAAHLRAPQSPPPPP